MLTLPTFMNKYGRCLVMRVYAPDPADVPFRVEQVCKTITAFDGISFEKRPSVKHILVLVFANPRFGARADCGQTAAAIRRALGQEGAKYATPRLKIPVVVEEVKHGEPCASMLNYAVQESGRAGCDYTFIVAPDAYQSVTESNFGAVYEACCLGAKAAGLVLNEYRDVLLHSGGVSNAFGVWENAALATVHYFDRYSAMPLQAEWAADGSPIIGGGAEEWLPLRWLADEYGACIAPVMPVDEGAYQMPDPVTQRLLWLRRQAVRSTKLSRRDAALAYAHAGPDDLIKAVMPKYRSNLMR